MGKVILQRKAKVKIASVFEHPTDNGMVYSICFKDENKDTIWCNDKTELYEWLSELAKTQEHQNG